MNPDPLSLAERQAMDTLLAQPLYATSQVPLRAALRRCLDELRRVEREADQIHSQVMHLLVWAEPKRETSENIMKTIEVKNRLVEQVIQFRVKEELAKRPCSCRSQETS